MNTESLKFKYMHRSYIWHLCDKPDMFIDNEQCAFKGILYIFFKFWSRWSLVYLSFHSTLIQCTKLCSLNVSDDGRQYLLFCSKPFGKIWSGTNFAFQCTFLLEEENVNS